MDKVDRSLGRELRRRRMANGDTLDSLAAKIRVADKTIGKWERGEVMPSATNIRSLEMLGLIEEWLDRNGSGAKQYPTIEMRICDVCTRLDDAVSIAALYANLISWLARKDRERALPSEPLTELIAENRWIAQRYGVFAFFGDQAPPGGRVDIQDFLEELVGELAADARGVGLRNRDAPRSERREERYCRRPATRPLPPAAPGGGQRAGGAAARCRPGPRGNQGWAGRWSRMTSGSVDYADKLPPSPWANFTPQRRYIISPPSRQPRRP